MDIKTLKYFKYAAENQSFRKAADIMNIEQSTVSKHISRLESELGCQLFVRSKQKVHLSDQGRIFLLEAEKILENMNNAVRKVKASNDGDVGCLRIGYRNTMSTCLPLYNAITAFQKTYPQIELQVSHMMSIEQCDALLDEKIDVAICYSPLGRYDDFERITISKEYVYIAVPSAHRFAHLESINACDLQAETFIGLRASKYNFMGDKFFDKLVSLGLEPEIIQLVDDDRTLISYVSLGIGISFMIAPNNESPPPGIALKPINDFCMPVNLELMWKKNNSSIIVKNLVRIMNAELNQTEI